MPHDNRPIGVFDSGLGGLTVVRALRERLPDEGVVYLGDTARLPYGTKSRDTILRFAREDADFLAGHEVKALVVACNTVSSLAMPALELAYPQLPRIGVVAAGVEALLGLERRKRVLVLGTSATVNSDSYRRLIHRVDAGVAVTSLACPLFVPLVEEGLVTGALAESVIRHYLAPMIAAPPDALILGCTHYPLLTETIADMLPSSVQIVDSAAACAASVARYLTENGATAEPGAAEPVERYYVTDMPASFFQLAQRFLGRPVARVDKVTVPE